MAHFSTGDTLLVGENYGRIKAMFDYNGSECQKSRALNARLCCRPERYPEAGDQFSVVESEKAARKIIAEEEWEISAETVQCALASISLEEFFSRLQEGETQIVEPYCQGRCTGLPGTNR